jgi:hypothetical protein
MGRNHTFLRLCADCHKELDAYRRKLFFEQMDAGHAERWTQDGHD